MTEEDNLSTMRGRLRFMDHIRTNHSNAARFYCEFDEFSHDNSFNQQLKSAIKVLKLRVGSAETERHLDDLEFAFSDVANTTLNVDTIQRFHFTRFTERYRPIFELLVLILFGKAPNMSSGEYSAPAMLFDMNMLFEEFIANKIAERVSSNKDMAGFKVVAQGKNKRLGINRFLLKPDIQIKRNNEVLAILDTKWKTIYPLRKKDISQADAYQMYAYAIRYNCKFNALIYPQVTSQTWRKIDDLYMSEKENIEDTASLHSFFLSVNFSSSNSNTEKELNEQIDTLLEEIRVNSDSTSPSLAASL